MVRNLSVALKAAGALLVAASGLHGAPARADEPSLTITPRSDLRFGTFAVFGRGSRTVTTQGMVFDSEVFAEPGSPTGPAQFDLVFDRGNESKFPVDVVIQLVLSGPNTFRQPGLNAVVSAFTSDLPGAAAIVPGRAFTITMSQCRQRVCTLSFSVGGRIDVTKHHGGAAMAIPLPFDATIAVIK